MPSPIESSPALTRILREEIEQNGSMRFERFMEVALYHPEFGYYVRGEKPIGKSGDFFTASQVQPVYALLVRQLAERLSAEAAFHLPKRITEYGAGRGEMKEGFSDWDYLAVEVNALSMPDKLSGLVFANELFDAIPVSVGIRRNGRVYEKKVTWQSDRFTWVEGTEPSIELECYASRYRVPATEGFEFEAHTRSLELLRDLLNRAKKCLFVFVDYGFTEREWKRFPAGSLMSYRRHQASPDVLADPGERDITSHVPFHVLMETAAECGAEVLRMERLALALLFAGELDAFAEVLSADSERERFERRQQLKTLLYGMGESFYVLALRKA